MRMPGLAHLHPWITFVVLVFLCPVSPGSWPGGAWVPWRALPWLLLVVLRLCYLCDPFIGIDSHVSLFHLQNGLRPNSC